MSIERIWTFRNFTNQFQLKGLETEELPDTIPPVEELIADHREFMENTARRQTEVDRACKPKAPPAPTKEVRKPSRGAMRSSV